MNQITVPGKIFLMGEYGVIHGGQAVLAALKPGYTYESGNGKPLHPDSPWGQFSKEINSSTSFSLQADRSSLPGLGGSTAELIAGSFFMEKKLPSTQTLWSWYQSHFPRASGADLATQLEALTQKKSVFSVSQKSEIKGLDQPGVFDQCYVFQTPTEQKLLTHEALAHKGLSTQLLSECNQWVERFLEACKSAQEQKLAVLTHFAQFLANQGLETQHAYQVRSAFSKLDFVIGVKGSGAGLHDLFIVAIKADQNHALSKEKLDQVASEYRLRSLGKLSELLW